MPKPEAASSREEDYELSSIAPSDPLLPTYQKSNAHISGETPHQPVIITRRRSRTCGALLCLWSVFVPLILITVLLGSWYGKRTLDSLRGWEAWEQVPQDVKDWLDEVAPGDYEGYVGKSGEFPTNIGYAGPTPTGAEPALLATAPSLPMYTAISPLVPPQTQKPNGFSIMQHWGNLSPYFSVPSHGLPETNSLFPPTCELKEIHWLQRHGARYPTTGEAGPEDLGRRLKVSKGWKASGGIKFLNEWEYKLGSEILTPFGRSQLYNLGVAARVKYGFMLDKMKGRLPVFRTESQDRMLKSAQNFAAGFFGIPAEKQYNLEVMIEWPGFNCTLAPYFTCPRRTETDPETWKKIHEWENVYLRDAQKRLQKDIKGYELSIRDVQDFMDICAYETVSLGYSAFCDLFTQKEWRGYEHRNEIFWWYGAAFGYPPAKAMGMGWVQELVSRLTHTRLTEFNSTTNSSFHDDVHFPLHDSLYVDFTHDTVFALLLPTMNLTSFAESGAPPLDHIPKHRTFIASQFCPFGTNMQIQVLDCHSTDFKGKNVRIILNDAVVPLTGIRGCPENDDGLCPLDTFVSAMQTLIGETDFIGDCGIGSVPETTGHTENNTRLLSY